MDIQNVSARIKSRFAELPAQLQVAARFVMENPRDVALLSMREQSRRARVPAATMTRLAKALGYKGFEEMRAIYVGAVRQSIDPFSQRAQGMVRQKRQVGEPSMTADMIRDLSQGVADLGGAEQREALSRAAAIVHAARRLYCVGQRSSFSAACHFAYLYSYFDTKAVLLDGPGGAGTDPLAVCEPSDAMLVVSMEPSARKSIEIARFGRARGLKIIAITNSEVSPVGRIADLNILVAVRAPAFFDAMTPAFAAAEVLVAMVASMGGDAVPAAVRLREEHRRHLGEWWDDK